MSTPEGVAYRKMSHFYRPTAPSDGFGHVIGPLEELDLEAEIRAYEEGWDDEGQKFFLGSPTYEDRAALVWIVEAARNLCGMDRALAVRLLRLALSDLEARTT